MPTDDARIVHESIEVRSWAPWLRFSLEDLRAYAAAFPEGQIVHLVDDRPAASLTTIRTDWSGDPDDLGTWDEVSGHDTSVAEAHDPDGNTMVMLSVSVHPDARGRGVPGELVAHARTVARRLDVEHLISPFRPSGYGRYKASGGPADFIGYAVAARDDGLPVDPWLRVLARLGMRPLRVCEQAMVVRATVDELEELRTRYEPEAWVRLEGSRALRAVSSVSADLVGSVDEVWECGETGSWYVSHDAGRATYVEDNLWGEIPIEVSDQTAPVAWTTAMRQVERRALERDLLDDLVSQAPDADVVLGWVSATDPRADAIRHRELQAFPDIEAFLDDEVESWCRFLIVVDLAEGPPQIGQAFRVSSPRYRHLVGDAVGMPTIDEIVATNDDIDLRDIVEYYDAMGVDLDRAIAVESSFRIDGRSRGRHGLRWSDFGYVELFREAKRGAAEGEERGVFAHVNEATVRSLAAIGVTVSPFAGRADLRSPASQPGTHDDRYAPVYITARHRNGELFSALEPLVPEAVRPSQPVIDLRDDRPVIDLRDRPAASAAARPVLSEQTRHQSVEE